MNRRTFLALTAAMPALPAKPSKPLTEMRADVLEDKIRGGFLGQLIGDLNGLKHEMKYIQEPGNVEQYTPALVDGGWTDDDTDVEWPYILEMQRSGNLMVPYQRIATLWKDHINRRIWCSHLYLRQLLDLGIDPPLTGMLALNPWADFNLSGQFVAESWGLISPGMPQTASRIGVHYTHVSIEGEAIQSTQMMDAMIATAFLTSDMEKVLDAGAATLDPSSVMSQIMTDVRRWHKENPKDWRVTRKVTKDKYSKFGGDDIRDRNGVWLNGASTISALLYGDGDFTQTLRSAFNFGWDADNNAAASGAILGIMKGNKTLMAQGWNIHDRFHNTSRDNMPTGETITSFGDRLIALARLNIKQSGGEFRTEGGQPIYRLPVEKPANIETLNDGVRAYAGLQANLKTEAANAVLKGRTSQEQARGAYLAICLDLAPETMSKHPEEWRRAVTALNGYSNVLQALFYESPIPAARQLCEKAVAVGVTKPTHSVKIWL